MKVAEPGAGCGVGLSIDVRLTIVNIINRLNEYLNLIN